MSVRYKLNFATFWKRAYVIAPQVILLNLKHSRLCPLWLTAYRPNGPMVIVGLGRSGTFKFKGVVLRKKYTYLNGALRIISKCYMLLNCEVNLMIIFYSSQPIYTQNLNKIFYNCVRAVFLQKSCENSKIYIRLV